MRRYCDVSILYGFARRRARILQGKRSSSSACDIGGHAPFLVYNGPRRACIWYPVGASALMPKHKLSIRFLQLILRLRHRSNFNAANIGSE